MELAEIAEKLPTICGEPAGHWALRRVWRDLLDLLARGWKGDRLAAARREFVLSTARLLVLPDEPIGSREIYFLHLRRQFGCLRGKVSDPAFPRWIDQIWMEFMPPAPRLPSSRKPGFSPNGTNPDGLGRPQLPEPVSRVPKHPVPLTGSCELTKRIPAAVHGTGWPHNVPLARWETERISRLNRLYWARRYSGTVSCDEAQYLGNGGAGHWSNPRSHD